MMLLVTFSRDWSDEFNCDGFKLFKSEEDWEKEKSSIENTNSFYFGTNEGWEDDTEDFIDSFTVKEITAQEYATLARLIPESAQSGFGIFPTGDSDDLWDADPD